MSTWTYRDEFATAQRDLVGYDVEATDGSIGKIDEATYETEASYMVVDTGFWIFGKKRLVPAGVARRVDPQDQQGLRRDDEGPDQGSPGLRRDPS